MLARVTLKTEPAPQLTLRAILTGMVLAAILAPSNIYAGLKIGFTFNMSMTSALLSYGVWHALTRVAGGRQFNILENNINQTAASSGASIAGAGLVAAVPALSMLTGYEWTFARLCVWILSVSVLGVAVALVVRRQMLELEKLPFPSGYMTGTLLKQMYARGPEALARVAALGAGALAGGLSKLGAQLLGWAAVPLPGSYAVATTSALFTAGVRRVSLANLTFAFDPSPLMVAVGAIIGLRSGISLLVGAGLAWGVLGPLALGRGWVQPGPADPSAMWFGGLVQWMLWPGVALMVSASLTALLLSWRSVARGLLTRHAAVEPDAARISNKLVWALLVVAVVFATVTQVSLFDIVLWTAVLGVALTFFLAVVAGRVTGETDITPIGAMGKVTQLFFGAIAPGGVTANLMAANVTGGAASQCADLLQDLRTGQIVGASPRAQAVAQFFGVSAGAAVGSAVYLVLVPDPSTMLLTEEWAAPAVATWKAVAEVFAHGLDAMPPHSGTALWAGVVAGAVLTVLERRLPPAAARFVPSPASIGLAMVIPASYALSMFGGAALAALLGRLAPSFSQRFLLVIAAGVVAGESLVGVGFASVDTLGGFFGG